MATGLFGWLLFACALVTLSVAKPQMVVAADTRPLLSTSRCGTNSKCGKGYNCFIERGMGSEGACIPKTYSASNENEEVCLHTANCAAVAALRRVCSGCIISLVLTCGPVPSIETPWYRERIERFRDCLHPTPDQIRASTVRSLGERQNSRGLTEIQQMPAQYF